jgi:phosphoenolpyruvate-protein phosphotransferase/dihydroxyacetone kinase phosphotransfer subunit
MIGIVLVSHSADLATAVKALAEQQTQGKSRIAAVGGTGDPEHPFGTDAMAILEAIQSVYSDEGVLVLMDLGSALMSTETAIEFMEPDQATHIQMSQAPFVEGAMAAAVQASIGMDLAAVAREAAEALGPKQESIGGAPADAAALVTQAIEPGEALTAKVTLVNPAGLHFGPAVLFVQTAAKSKAAITVRNLTTGAGPVDAKRFNQVLSLGAEHGHEIEVALQGADAQATLDELLALARAGFGEKIAETPSATAPAVQPMEAIEGRGRLTLHGIPASPGIAVGTAFSLADHLRASSVGERRSSCGAEAESARYQSATTQAASELADLAERMERELGPEQSRIFQAHALALQDPDLVAAVQRAITHQELTAEAAVFDATEAQAARYEQMSGPRFQERAADMRDVQARMLRILSGAEEAAVHLPEDAIVIAPDLAPSQTTMLDRSKVVAFCTERGGPTAHTAILARSMGIPAVVGLGAEAYAQIKPGTILAIEGSAGAVIIEPEAETVAAYRARQAEQVEARHAAYAAARAAAKTQDGHRVEVVANLAAAAEVQLALDAGAEGVGLLRTEFLFQDRTEPPTEDEQYEAYRQVAEDMSPRPVIIRTLDIGGDKPSPYLRLPVEMNPFLGWRAIRISLAMPEFFKTQLRAILRSAVTGNILVMFPMIAVRSEVEQAQALLAEATKELVHASIPHADKVPTGIMVEVPAAAETPDLLTPAVDFFSIGTNDLTQYTFAVDRGNARVAKLGDPLHPAVLRQISRVIEAAHAQGKWVGLCGELAGQPEAIPVLLGLGLDEFSMGPASIPAAKGILARWTLPAAQALARQALNLPDGAAVRAAVTKAMEKTC